MSIDPCALVELRSVVRAKFKGTEFGAYRYLASDPDNGVAAFFDLEYYGIDLDKMFVVTPLSVLAALADDEIQEIRDTYLPPPPAAYRKRAHEAHGTDLNETKEGRLKKWLDQRWKAIKGIVDQTEANPVVMGDHPVSELFLNATWRAEVIPLHAASLGQSDIPVRRHLGTFLRFGGTPEALAPRMPGRCGAPDRPKAALLRAEKFGRKTTTQRRGRASWHAKNGVGPFWLARITAAVDMIVKRDGKGAWATLQDDDQFWDFFLENCCFITDAVTGKLKAVPDHKIPTPRAVLYRRNRLLEKRPELQPQWRTLSAAHGGYATDLTYGVLDVGDIDAAVFSDYCLAVAKDETQPVGRNNYVQIGTPTVFLGFCRKSAAAVGCEIDCNPEYGDPYRYVMYDMMLDIRDKRVKLRELDLDPEKLPGIVSGGFDVIVADRGGAASHKVMQWTVAQKMDIRLTRSGAPMDKGTAEGGIGRIKQWLRKQRRAMKKLIVRRTLRKLKALPKSFLNLQYIIDNHNERREAKRRRVIILPKLVFIRAVIEAMNEINLLRKKDPRCLTEEMRFSAEPPEPTAAGIFRYYQSLRHGTANYARRETDLVGSLLWLEDCEVRGGRIELGPCWYGSPSGHEIGRAGAERLVAYVAQVAGDSSAPSKVLVRAVRVPHKNLVWCLLPTGEWLLLAPEEKSAAAYGVFRDISETKALHEDWCMQKEEAEKRKAADRVKSALSARALAEAAKILNSQQAQEESWSGVKEVDRAAQQKARKSSKHERFNRAASGHSLPEIVEPALESDQTNSALPVPLLPGAQWKTRSVSAMLADNDDSPDHKES
ncbi:hypothetical protein [Cupriavidus necator]